MSDINTFDDNDIVISTDPLYNKQKEGVAKMRASLLSCGDDTGDSIGYAVRSVAAMQVYHQLTRIIRYTELMDKLEDKLYEAIDRTVTDSSSTTSSLIMLLNIQEKLQKNMIDSQKVLQPYLDFNELTFDIPVQSDTVDTAIMSPESRDRVRASAQAILLHLNAG